MVELRGRGGPGGGSPRLNDRQEKCLQALEDQGLVCGDPEIVGYIFRGILVVDEGGKQIDLFENGSCHWHDRLKSRYVEIGLEEELALDSSRDPAAIAEELFVSRADVLHAARQLHLKNECPEITRLIELRGGLVDGGV